MSKGNVSTPTSRNRARIKNKKSFYLSILTNSPSSISRHMSLFGDLTVNKKRHISPKGDNRLCLRTVPDVPRRCASSTAEGAGYHVP